MAGHESSPWTCLGSFANEGNEGIHFRTSQTHMGRRMRHEVALTYNAHSILKQHLLQHFEKGQLQEDLCFALWRKSTSSDRTSALIDEVLVPAPDERLLHGNASFMPEYMARAIRQALDNRAGLAFLHSHPGPGWQGMSQPDVVAERDILAYPTAATELPLVGLTMGSDGYWSARFWQRNGSTFDRIWCDKVRVVGPDNYTLCFRHIQKVPSSATNRLRRSIETWGADGQATISHIHVGIVGLGSVGSQVAEALVRMGVTHLTLVDPDRVEEHNLDRLLNSTIQDIGSLKVEVVAKALHAHAIAPKIEVTTFPISVHNIGALDAILGCDLIFSCVDRPVARDVLNYVATAHLIPVIDGGVEVQHDYHADTIFSAHWRSQLITPCHRCMRCSEQYSTGMVMAELDGSLDDPNYLKNLPKEEENSGANVFSFSQHLASTEVNLGLRYMLGPDWWKPVSEQTHQMITGETYASTSVCEEHCMFRDRIARGDEELPFYLIGQSSATLQIEQLPKWKRKFRAFGSLFSNIGRQHP